VFVAAAVLPAAAVDCEMVFPLASLTVVVTDPSALVTTVVTSAVELELLDPPRAPPDFDAPPDLPPALNVLIGVAAAPTLARLVMMVFLRLDTLLTMGVPQAVCQLGLLQGWQVEERDSKQEASQKARF